jgi:uncharacterized membrane protein YhiD involved in acid resistance
MTSATDSSGICKSPNNNKSPTGIRTHLLIPLIGGCVSMVFMVVVLSEFKDIQAVIFLWIL